MIILYTKKLQEFLETNSIPLPVSSNEDALWHGNIFIFQRKKVLQLTHEKTRYTLFVHGVTKKELKDLPVLIRKHIRYHILKDGIELQVMKYIDAMSEHFSYFKKPDRKVQGTMNNMKAIYEHYCLNEESIDDKGFSHKINHMIFTIDGRYQEPVDAFREYMLYATFARSFVDNGKD